MFAADEVVALDVVARTVQHRYPVLFRKSEDSRKVGNLDESKVNGYMPKAIAKLFDADAFFRSNAWNVLEADRQGNNRLLQRSDLLHVVDDDRRYRLAESCEKHRSTRNSYDVVAAKAREELGWL